jgi:Ricin-type beta-trefoil lectin domain
MKRVLYLPWSAVYAMKDRTGRGVRLAATGSAVLLAATLLAGMSGVGAANAARAAPAANDPFYLVNALTGYCLGIHNGSTNDGYAQQQNCTGTGSQAWYWNGNYDSAGYQQLENQSSDVNQRCLSVKDESTAVNTQLTGYTCKPSSRPDQFWNYTTYDGNTGCYEFSSAITLSYAAGVSGASTAEYAEIINANPNKTTGDGQLADVWCAFST